jgi:hypothetical protein
LEESRGRLWSWRFGGSAIELLQLDTDRKC